MPQKAIKGIYENGVITPLEKVPFQGKTEVLILFPPKKEKKQVKNGNAAEALLKVAKDLQGEEVKDKSHDLARNYKRYLYGKREPSDSA